MLVAALGDLQIADGAGCRKNAFLSAVFRPGKIFQMHLPDQVSILVPAGSFQYRIHSADDLIDGCRAEHGVHFRDLLHDVLLITLCETAGDDQSLQLPGFTAFREFQYGIDALLLCIMNKTAGIDCCNICCFFIVCEFISVF
jgi:hypothetical protein